MKRKRLGLIAVTLSIIASLTIIFGNPLDLLNRNDELDKTMREDVIVRIDAIVKELESAKPRGSTGIKITGDSSRITVDNVTFENLGKGIDIEGKLKNSSFSNITSKNTDVTIDINGILEDVKIINVEIKNEDQRAQLIDSLNELNSNLKNNPEEKSRIKRTLESLQEGFGYLGPIVSLAKDVASAFL